MLATGWYLADPILSAGIGLLILRSSWKLLSESVNVLIEAAPEHVDIPELRKAMVEISGVHNLHDVHVRTVTSGLVALSGHIEIDGSRDWHEILLEASDLVREKFGISHVTFQPEEPRYLPDAFRGCSLDCPEGLEACRVPVRRDSVGDHGGHAH